MSDVLDLFLDTDDGECLEALWWRPRHPRGVLVFCHPHPLQQGTMRAPLMEKMARRLTENEVAVLRFNFRGVGNSTGQHGGGLAELADISAAIVEADRFQPELPHGLAGWSFGAAASLNWLARNGNRRPWIGIAPPVRSASSPDLPRAEDIKGGGPKAFVLGERDQFTTVEDLDAYASSIGASLTVVNSDHFFFGQEERVADIVETTLFPVRNT